MKRRSDQTTAAWAIASAVAAASLAGCGGAGGSADNAASDGGERDAVEQADGSSTASDATTSADGTPLGDAARADSDSMEAASGGADALGSLSDSASGSQSDSGSGDGSSATSADGSSGACVPVEVEGGACNSLTKLPQLMATCSAGAEPTPQGGAIENGTYVTSAATIYGCDAGPVGFIGETYSICGDRWDQPGASFQATYHGSSVTLTEICPSSGSSQQLMWGYTATPGHLALFGTGFSTGEVIDHVRQ